MVRLRLLIRLIIFFFIIGIIIYFVFPIPMPCFCDNGIFFIKCLDDSKLTDEQCNQISHTINDIDKALYNISSDIYTFINSMKLTIPTIPNNVPSIAAKVSEINFSINNTPQIQDLQFKCSIILPFSKITNNVNDTLTKIETNINDLGNDINKSTLLQNINSVTTSINAIKTKIDSFKPTSGKLKIGFGCQNNYKLVGLSCIPLPPNGYETHTADIVNYYLKDSASYTRTARDHILDKSVCDEFQSDGVKYYDLTCTGCKCNKVHNCLNKDKTCNLNTGSVVTRSYNKSCPQDTSEYGGICYDNCRTEYTTSGVTCTNNNPGTKPIDAKQIQIPTITIN